jgi:hypothetical protein
MTGGANDAVDVWMDEFLVEQHGWGIEPPRRQDAKVFSC